MSAKSLVFILPLLLQNAWAAPYVAYASSNALIPGIHIGLDRSDHINLIPQDKITIFYEGRATDQPTAASITFSNAVHKTIVLEHIAHVSSISCSGSTIKVAFGDTDAFRTAQKSWTEEAKHGLILVSYQQGCGAAFPAQRSWLSVKSVQSFGDSNAITASFSEMIPEESAGDMDIEFGHIAKTPLQSRAEVANNSVSSPDFDVSKSFNFIYTPAATDDTVFGKAYPLAQVGTGANTLGLYCVSCGANGQFTVSGHVSAKLLPPKITKIELDLDGSLKASLVLAMAGAATKSFPFSKRVFSQSLSSFSIPKIISVGPSVTMDLGATLALHAKGGIEYGWTFGWPVVKAQLDLLNFKAGSSGFTPTGAPVFNYQGDAAAELNGYALIGLRFGIDVLKGKWTADVGLIDKPSVDIGATVQIHSPAQISALPEGSVLNDGLCYSAGVANDLYAEGTVGKASRSIDIAKWNGPKTSKCLKTQTVHHAPAKPTKAG
ncbi:hypothetical protein BT63DRAFT_449344 [Microthyrium microscopicum]|uniref:Acid protease n=1 Tax=Microthyrium microscopicum TaxID=703497 RepID=A0A6A6UQ09_9PEZI|nr:hypothetical protein BT63DRAFT_449344 [Microthyrium microscopicum]